MELSLPSALRSLAPLLQRADEAERRGAALPAYFLRYSAVKQGMPVAAAAGSPPEVGAFLFALMDRVELAKTELGISADAEAEDHANFEQYGVVLFAAAERSYRSGLASKTTCIQYRDAATVFDAVILLREDGIGADNARTKQMSVYAKKSASNILAALRTGGPVPPPPSNEADEAMLDMEFASLPSVPSGMPSFIGVGATGGAAASAPAWASSGGGDGSGNATQAAMALTAAQLAQQAAQAQFVAQHAAAQQAAAQAQVQAQAAAQYAAQQAAAAATHHAVQASGLVRASTEPPVQHARENTSFALASMREGDATRARHFLNLAITDIARLPGQLQFAPPHATTGAPSLATATESTRNALTAINGKSAASLAAALDLLRRASGELPAY